MNECKGKISPKHILLVKIENESDGGILHESKYIVSGWRWARKQIITDNHSACNSLVKVFPIGTPEGSRREHPETGTLC